MTDAGRKFTLIFNSMSKSSAIPTAMKIATMHPHEIKEDGLCHVTFHLGEPEMVTLLDLVDGLKGTLLIDNEGRKYKSKEQFEQNRDLASIQREKEREKAELEIQRQKNDERKQLQKMSEKKEKELTNLSHDVEKTKRDHDKARKDASHNLRLVIAGGFVHLLISFIPMMLAGWSLSASIIASTIAFVFSSVVFALFCPEKYALWEKAVKRADDAKKAHDRAVRGLREARQESSMDIPQTIMDPSSVEYLLEKGFLVKMNDVRTIMGLDQSRFDAIIVDIAIELGIWIDGDALVVDKWSRAAFMDRLKHFSQRHKLMERIAITINDKHRVQLRFLQDITGLAPRDLDEQVIYWAEQFGFKIDGDEIVLDPETGAGFISALQAFST